MSLGRFTFCLAILATLFAVTVHQARITWGASLSPILLGFVLGLVFAETPMASPLQGFLGLSSRNADKVGLDIIHGNSQSKDSLQAKVELDHKTMYGLQHAFLNLEVTGWWFNMGLWDKDKPMRFQDACKALVRKVTTGLDIGQGSHILDVGFGCGDQDIYMAQLYQPSKITGITIEPIQHHAAQDLVKRTPTPGTSIELHVADGSKLPEFLASNSSVLGPSGDLFTHVVSIDSAYHYNTRAQFLENASRALVSGTGRLAMADMILAKPGPTSGLSRKVFEAVFGAMEIPAVNMKSLEEYRKDFVDAGFVDVEIECIEDRVFSGLAGYIDGQTSRLGGMVKPGVNWTYWGLSKGLWWLHRSQWLHFVVVRARKASGSE